MRRIPVEDSLATRTDANIDAIGEEDVLEEECVARAGAVVAGRCECNVVLLEMQAGRDLSGGAALT